MAKESLQDLTKLELYERAQKADVPGRSQMTRAELIKSLSNGKSEKRPKKSRKRAEATTTKRSIWSGAITFGLITIPVGLYTATEDRDIAFHLLSGNDKSRIQYKRVSSKTGREVEWEDIVKGYEYQKGKYVVFTPDELDQIAPESARTIDVVRIVDASEIDPIYFEKSYFVAPSKVGAKAYKLFLRALSESERVAVAKVTIREKERLCILRVKEDLLVLETMNWPDEIRVPDFEQVKDNSRISADELKMARLLIDHLSGEFDPSEFEDSYRQRLLDAIDAKIQGNEIALAPAEAEPATVSNLLEALKASVDQTRAKRSA
jgi:DNA end-binding protein Ku